MKITKKLFGKKLTTPNERSMRYFIPCFKNGKCFEGLTSSLRHDSFDVGKDDWELWEDINGLRRPQPLSGRQDVVKNVSDFLDVLMKKVSK